jgi:hypothetical protein
MHLSHYTLGKTKKMVDKGKKVEEDEKFMPNNTIFFASAVIKFKKRKGES